MSLNVFSRNGRNPISDELFNSSGRGTRSREKRLRISKIFSVDKQSKTGDSYT